LATDQGKNGKEAIPANPEKEGEQKIRRSNRSVKLILHEIETLAAQRAPAGLEHARGMTWQKICEGYCSPTQISQDSLGNVIIRIPPVESFKEKDSPLRILLMAHLDEIGGNIYKIQKNGRLLFNKRGGFEARWLISRRVEILALNGTWIKGIILGRTVHAIPPEARNKPGPSVEELEIFIGADTEEQVIKAGIHIGAPVVFENYTSLLSPEIDPDLIISNSFDDLVGICVLTELLARFQQGNPFQAEIIITGVVREEIGSEGAIFVGNNLHPTHCIGIDFGVVESDKVALDCGGRLKGGPMIVWAESQGRGVFDYEIGKTMVSAAEAAHLPYQHAVFAFYGSDAGRIQAHYGIPSILIGVPLLNGHNNAEIIALSEIGKAADLIWAWLGQQFGVK
jgi:endoglucanase